MQLLQLRRHPFGMAKNSRLGVKGSVVIRERKFCNLDSVSSGATPPPLLLMGLLITVQYSTEQYSTESPLCYSLNFGA